MMQWISGFWMNVCLYEDFFQIGKFITTKAYNSALNNFTKALQSKVVWYHTKSKTSNFS